MLDVGSAPAAPGIYAWYASFRASPQDWLTRPHDGQDAATDGFFQLLREYAGYHEPLPITLKGSATYGGAWSGELELDHGIQTMIRNNGDAPMEVRTEKDRDALADTVNSPEGRRILASVLGQATPVFSSPLYIGITENLRQRLEKHRKDYTHGMEYLSEHPGEEKELQAKANGFGLRAAARGIAMENLEVWVIDLNNDENRETTDKELKETARSAEWLLHRLFSPVLGRQ
ncbi:MULTISPECIES: GIY-YIG nuclease family protein [Rhodococcus]|jgi:hypothetical protein|nr:MULTISPECIES: GIY-YIG nuclease family protein [Rhodococcus]MCT6736150.1 GIY-YIG nuclease family protein [Rhodococcus qingshengii]MDI9945075.1 GIY-YIG nuclease family protein [Rhodococcus sp. IEGM 1302]MDJ0434822.1 GIY-YIG nuclease family protein [Rhodococcus qingshengii]QEM26347.1 GIY-YIG nuclease family protein [Rhodococcus qingshengii]WOI87316.1 GIY-YIG nuclease family protein [Rhodococcus qingshengii]